MEVRFVLSFTVKKSTFFTIEILAEFQILETVLLHNIQINGVLNFISTDCQEADNCVVAGPPRRIWARQGPICILPKKNLTGCFL